MSTVQFLLQLADEPANQESTSDREQQNVAAIVEAVGRHNRRTDRAGVVARVLVPVRDATLATAHADLMDEAPFDAVIELTDDRPTPVDPVALVAPVNPVDPVALVDELAGLLRTLEVPIDLRTSAVLVGTEHIFVAGEDAFRLQVFITAAPALTHDAFVDHWLNRHGELIRPTRTGPPYRQFHAEPAASARAALAIGTGIRHLAGAAIAGYAEVDTYRRALSNRERMAPIIEDETRFIDHARSCVALYRVL